MDPGSQAQGVVIGFETPQGQPLALNAWSQNSALENGNNSIAIQAYVQGEPAAITNKTIKLGLFLRWQSLISSMSEPVNNALKINKALRGDHGVENDKGIIFRWDCAQGVSAAIAKIF